MGNLPKEGQGIVQIKDVVYSEEARLTGNFKTSKVLFITSHNCELFRGRKEV